jgi:hypothetical protein
MRQMPPLRPILTPALIVIAAACGGGETAGMAAASGPLPEAASFVIYENDQRVGTMETAVSRTGDGWRIRSSLQTAGAVPVAIPNLDIHYDPQWFGRFLTMEMKAPDAVIVHVAVAGAVTRTDIVREKSARFQSSSVSPNTILLPDRAYGAYEAVAARLAGSHAGDLPIFVAPIGETRAVVDQMTMEPIKTVAGILQAAHYVLTEIRSRPTRVDLWTDRGRLLRLDVPRDRISVRRTDITP